MKLLILFLMAFNWSFSSVLNFDELNPQQRYEGVAQQRFLLKDSIPADYIVGPGDIIEISIDDKIFPYQIGPQNDIMIEGVSTINLFNMTISQAKEKILEEVTAIIGAPKILSIRLIQAKLIRVKMSGAIGIPKTIGMHYGDDIDDALNYVLGFKLRANPNNIELRKANGRVISIDYSLIFLNKPPVEEYTIENGDEIFVPFLSALDSQIVISDTLLNLPFPFKEEYSVDDYYKLSRLFDESKTSSYNMFAVVSTSGKVKRYSLDEAPSVFLKSGEQIIFDSAIRSVLIGGAIDIKGHYIYRPNWKVIDYLSKAGTSVISESLDRVKIVDSRGTEKFVNAYEFYPEPGDFIEIDRSFFEYFKEWVGITGSLAATISTLVLLKITIDNN